MAQILVVKPQTLTVADKRKLRNAGVVAVEAERPEEVRLLTPEGPPLTGDDLLFCALKGVNYSSTAQIKMAEHMLEALERAQEKLQSE